MAELPGMPGIVEPWPLGGLSLRTPRLELRPDDDEGLRELVALAYLGVHDPDVMPFLVPWTDAPAADLGRNMLQFYWRQRAAVRPQRWSVSFLVRHEGAVIGMQSLGASDFAVVREVDTGSWLGLGHQGRGLGTEMRAAVLMFAFDRLGAHTARSEAFLDNLASHGVSRRLGYAADGTATVACRGEPVVEQRLLLTRAAFDQNRPQWTLRVRGLTAECRTLLGAT
jgi:RimJ/RimL family protein N-acetyltransferase